MGSPRNPPPGMDETAYFQSSTYELPHDKTNKVTERPAWSVFPVPLMGS